MNSVSPWKMIYLAKRNPKLRPEEFPQAWREHSALGKTCTNVIDRVRSVTQCVRLLDGTPTGCSTEYDGVNLLGLRDRESADAIWSDPETLAVMRPDEPRVFDRYVREFTLVARELVLQPGVSGDAVLIGFFKLRPEISGQELEQFLRTQPSAYPGSTRSVLNLVEPDRPAGYDYDAIVEWWFTDPSALLQVTQSLEEADGFSSQFGHLIAPEHSVLVATRVNHRRG